MKFILLVLLLLSLSLEASSPQMRTFRMQQRHLVLAEFKKLYKQRHLYRHRVRMLRHHRRVKTVDHSTVMRMHRHQTAVADEAMPQDMVSGMQTNIKTKANHDLDWMREHMPQTDGDRKREPMHIFDDAASGSEGGEDSAWGPQDGSMQESISGQGQDVSVPGSESDSDVPHERPEADVPADTTQPHDESGGEPAAFVPSDGTETAGVPGTQSTDQDGKIPSQMGDGSVTQDIRPRFADPWRRR